ncbi:hypothetical protein D9619_010713 [Psilocybe cf. subviscida]|uniref:FAD-binding domain-containing protein n=1 Tax=Psilocybe cf. subviscida TaxID=2480587 RepID=A0A8H5EZR9_9AGAR|nr:hypothetical protein D9619_010713 [Psilocybe cf. subviscida]
MSKPRLAIIGSGIGGLALAVALSRLGVDKAVDIDIYEATTKLAQVGAGITLWPRGWEILELLGVGAALSVHDSISADEVGLERDNVPAFSYRKSDRAEGVPIVDVCVPGGPRPFHRADVQDVLLGAISSSIRTHLSHRLVSYEETPSGIVLKFQNGTTAHCDMVVGADGVNSAVRRCLVESGRISNPDCAEPRWTGTNVYRGLIASDVIRRVSPNHRALHMPMMYCGKNKASHVVAFPVLQGKLTNVVMFVSDPEKEGSLLEGPAVQNTTSDDLFALYAGWEDDVQCIVQNFKNPSKWAIQTVGPLDKYAESGIFLLGDAAHAMSLHLGNGAGQAIEDAYFLANILDKGISKGASIEEISQVYNRIRQPWGNFVVEATRLQGRLYEFSNTTFESVKEGDEVAPETLKELGNKIRDGWGWTWKNSSSVPLREGLAKL